MAWLVVDNEPLRKLGHAYGIRCHGRDPKHDEACSDDLCGGVTSWPPGPTGTYWGCCPWTAMGDPAFQAGLRLYNASLSNPLAGWEHEYTAFAADIVMTIGRVSNERERRDLEARRKRGK